jgi:MSHA biogenesis protein MshP
MGRVIKSQQGLSIIAALFIIVILAFMGLIFLSFISTSSFTSLNDMQSAQALSVAEGGLEYILANRTFPNYSMSGATVNLGAGSFTISTPASLTVDPGAAGTTITVQSTANFPNTGRIIIDSELIDYTGKTATTFNPATRGVGGTTAVAHAVGNAVYPVTTVTDNPLAAGSATINVTSNVGFSIPGVIVIDMEYIYCGSVVGTTQFTNCIRGFKGSAAASHPNLSMVFQYNITSTGTVGSAQRVVARSVLRQSAGAMMVYAKLNGDGVPYYRRWDGTSWGPELTATAVPANIQYIILRFARTRNEAVLGTLSSNGDIRVQIWNGSAWGATLLLANVGTTDDNYRGFDIEYETNGDRAIVVYNDGTSNPDYRIWNGVGWSGAGNINVPTTGSPNWIEVARNPLAGSSEIALILLDSNSDVYGMRWTGAAWNNMGAAAVWDAGASTSTYKAVHVAYEQQTGRALFVWGRNVNASIRYRIWDGANLGAVTNQSIANIGNHTARWVRLAPDPYSNNIMRGIQDSGSDLITSLWNGAVWDANGIQHDSSLEDASRNFDLVYETAAANAGRAWVLWGNGSMLSRRQWNGAAWGGIATTGDDTSFVQMVAHPLSGAVLSGIYESTNSGAANRDIWESHLTQGSAIWSPRVMIWGGRTVAAPVMERLSLAPEGYNPLNSPLLVFDWNEVVR